MTRRLAGFESATGLSLSKKYLVSIIHVPIMLFEYSLYFLDVVMSGSLMQARALITHALICEALDPALECGLLLKDWNGQKDYAQSPEHAPRSN